MAAPNQINVAKDVGTLPIATYTASYQINGGSNVTAGASITDSVTFTGAATTDTRVGLAARDAVLIPAGLQLVSVAVSATNTVAVTWRNATGSTITPPASATWTLVVLSHFKG